MFKRKNSKPVFEKAQPEEIQEVFPERATVVNRTKELPGNAKTSAAALGYLCGVGAGGDVPGRKNSAEWLDLEVARKPETTQGDNSHITPETFQAG